MEKTSKLNYLGKTKFGMDKIDVALEIMPIFFARTPSKFDEIIANIKIFIFCRMSREMTALEDLNLHVGVLNFYNSEPETNERLDASEYLFNLEFIQDEK